MGMTYCSQGIDAPGRELWLYCREVGNALIDKRWANVVGPTYDQYFK